MDVNENEAPENINTNSNESTSIDNAPEEKLAAKLDAKDGVEKAIIDLLKEALDKKHFDAVLIPHRVPSGDSFIYLLIQDPAVLDTTSPMAPIMPIQGASALSSVTHLGTDGLKLAAVLRPCEVSAAIEISKLDQNNLDDVMLISIDCPGVLPTKVFNEDPEKGLELFNNGLKDWNTEAMRPVCQVCTKSNSAFGDLHIGRLGTSDGSILVIPNTQKGHELITTLGMKLETKVDDWTLKTEEMAQARQSKRKEAIEEIRKNKLGLDNLLDTLSSCLKCHNCMRVCPVDNCLMCYFESDVMKYPPEEYFGRAQHTGSLRFPTDSLQYHMGRILHMSLSCVSCGTCEDACPMSIPIAQIYNYVANNVQEVFDYVPGMNATEPQPLNTYELEEFTELES
jgi:formate dehydrogenase subunit beta